MLIIKKYKIKKKNGLSKWKIQNRVENNRLISLSGII